MFVGLAEEDVAVPVEVELFRLAVKRVCVEEGTVRVVPFVVMVWFWALRVLSETVVGMPER